MFGRNRRQLREPREGIVEEVELLEQQLDISGFEGSEVAAAGVGEAEGEGIVETAIVFTGPDKLAKEAKDKHPDRAEECAEQVQGVHIVFQGPEPRSTFLTI
jgi:hypothetical protein